MSHNWVFIVIEYEHFTVGGGVDFGGLLGGTSSSELRGVLDEMGLDSVVGGGSRNHLD